MRRYSSSALLRGLVLVGGLSCIIRSEVRADPPVVAKLDMNQEGQTLSAELRFDLAGGPVSGSANLNIASNRENPPERQDGGPAPGRFHVTADLKGQYDGGRFAPLAGAATLSGTFTDEAGCEAKVRGAGKLSGNVSAPLGMLELALDWPGVEFDGCGLASPQPFGAKLPLLNFSPIEESPTKRGATAAAPAPTPSGAVAATGSATITGSVTAPAAVGGSTTTASVAAPGAGGGTTTRGAAPPAVAAPPVVAAQPAVAAPPVAAVAPVIAAPPAVVAVTGAGSTAIENSPTYMPKDEALDHKRKADESEDLATSLQEYQEALKIEPRYAPWWSNLGEKLGENGRWQEAETAFRRAVELNPNEPEYRANLALALLRQGHREEAIKEAKAAREMARAQNNGLHASHPVYAELTLQVLGLPADPPPLPPTPAPTQVSPQQQKAYRGLKFSVAGVKRVKEFEGSKAEAGKEIVVVSTVINRSKFESDSRGNECRMDRAVLIDAADERYKSTEQQRRVTVPLRNEDGTLAGTQALPYDWSFEVPEGARVKTFTFVFADERVNTGGADPDENVSDLSFDLE